MASVPSIQKIGELKDLFLKAAQGDPAAKVWFEKEIRECSQQIMVGKEQRELLHSVTNAILLDAIEKKLPFYPDLQGRHFRTSIGHRAWIRLVPFLEKLERGEEVSSKYIGWLLELTKHVLTDLVTDLRKNDGKKAPGVDVDGLAGNDLPTTMPEDDPHFIINQALPQLPLEDRICIRLKYQNKWTEAQIGELLDLSTGQVGYRVTQAQKELRRLIPDPNA